MWQKVILPIAKCLNHRIEFLIISGVSLSGIIQFLTEVSNWMTFLSETPPIPIPDASHATSKTLEKSGRRMTGALTILFLISTNDFVTA